MLIVKKGYCPIRYSGTVEDETSLNGRLYSMTFCAFNHTCRAHEFSTRLGDVRLCPVLLACRLIPLVDEEITVTPGRYFIVRLNERRIFGLVRNNGDPEYFDFFEWLSFAFSPITLESVFFGSSEVVNFRAWPVDGNHFLLHYVVKADAASYFKEFPFAVR